MASPWTLHITDEDGLTRAVTLDGDEALIGRGDDAAILLDRPTVSRRHARLRRDGQGWRLTDLNSRGGTFLLGQRISDVKLASGDTFTISRFTLRLDGGRPPAARPRRDGTSVWSHESADPHISVLTRIAPPKLDTSQITGLHEFGRRLMDVADPQHRLAALCEVMTGEIIRGRWAMALRLDADDPSHPPLQLAAAPAELAARGDVHLSRTAIAAMQQSQAPVLASNFAQDGGVVEMSIVSKGPATAAVACPLANDPASHDLIYVNLPPMFGTSEWLALVALAVQQHQLAEAAWAARETARAQAAVERDLLNAREIQRSILPRRDGTPGLDVAWSFEPCDLIGGDCVDVVPMPDGRVLLMVADVTGHGLPAALATLAVHSVMHTGLAAGHDPAAVVSTLNAHLCQFLPDGRFVTLVCVAVDLRTGDIEWVNAGHQPPCVLTPTGEAPHRALADSDNLPLGLDPQPLSSQRDRLRPDDVLLLWTDGLTELHTDADAMLGTAGVTALATHALADSPADLHAVADAIRTRLHTLRGPRPALDDMTFLLARPHPQPTHRQLRQQTQE